MSFFLCVFVVFFNVEVDGTFVLFIFCKVVNNKGIDLLEVNKVVVFNFGSFTLLPPKRPGKDGNSST